MQIKILYGLYLISIAIFLTGCGEEDNDEYGAKRSKPKSQIEAINSDSSHTVHNQKVELFTNSQIDTMISEYNQFLLSQKVKLSININGSIQKIYVDSIFVDDALGIDEIATKFKDRKLDSTLVRYLDITGRKKPEKIITRVFISNDSVYFSRKIFRDNKLIYKHFGGDRLCDTTGGDDYGVIPAFCVLEPYASFHNSLKDIDIYNDLFERNLKLYENDTFIKFVIFQGIIERKYTDKAKIKGKIEEFRRYVVNFKGAVLNSHDEMDAIPEIWYEPEKSFIELY